MCTATAQGDVTVHNSEGAQLNAVRAHEGGALALCMLPRFGEGAGATAEDSDRQQDATCMVLTGGQDCSVKLWEVPASGAPTAVLRCA